MEKVGKHYFHKRSFFLGLIKINYYVEYRGEKAETKYKHFIKIKIPFKEIRWTIRSPYAYEGGPYYE